jgi:hypothetical protein
MASRSGVELQSIRSHNSTAQNEIDIVVADSEPTAEIEIPSLPPTDHGRDAYLVLLGCTVIQAPVWGTQ